MKNRITVIGTGYVGLVTGTCLSDFGLNVICVDNDVNKIEKLRKGIIPIYEPGLDVLVEKNYKAGRLEFTTDTQYGVENSEVIFIAVGTPPEEDGSADMQYVMAVARDIARYMNGYKVVVNKSTVPVGTGRLVKKVIQENQTEPFEFDVVSNPEFLREGAAVYDFMHPDRVVIGAESERAFDAMKKVYRVLFLNQKTPFLFTDIETSETIKYASNAFLATKITFINEMATLCERVGANVVHVARGMGMDGRIGNKFLNPGPGYGGSCFPKDTRALARIGEKYGVKMTLVETTIQANEAIKLRMVEKIADVLGELKGKRIGILGLAFKPETDDMREAPALVILPELYKRGAILKVYDPQAMEEAKWRLKDVHNLTLCENEYEAAQGVDALVILTEWNQFRSLDLVRMMNIMRSPCLFDLRNIYDPKMVKEIGFEYYSVGR
ncbi:MAG: UDP-glucose/GDP-mannose dehydrogenase family protein [Clostridiaceae bacterium]|nr:UDP-glucose/GDP-mannose dehydrogenase family protein [Clostridiaceae bacterium]